MWMDTYESAAETTLNIYYHAEIDGHSEIKNDPHEVAEAGWFPPGGLPDNIAFRATCRRCCGPGKRPRSLKALPKFGFAVTLEPRVYPVSEGDSLRREPPAYRQAAEGKDERELAPPSTKAKTTLTCVVRTTSRV